LGAVSYPTRRKRSFCYCSRRSKAHFEVATFMHNSLYLNQENQNAKPTFVDSTSDKVIFTYEMQVEKGQTIALSKIRRLYRIHESRFRLS